MAAALPAGTPAGFELQVDIGGFLPPEPFPTGSFPRFST
jgi:hypothetical protein